MEFVEYISEWQNARTILQIFGDDQAECPSPASTRCRCDPGLRFRNTARKWPGAISGAEGRFCSTKKILCFRSTCPYYDQPGRTKARSACRAGLSVAIHLPAQGLSASLPGLRAPLSRALPISSPCGASSFFEAGTLPLDAGVGDQRRRSGFGRGRKVIQYAHRFRPGIGTSIQKASLIQPAAGVYYGFSIHIGLCLAARRKVDLFKRFQCPPEDIRPKAKCSAFRFPGLRAGVELPPRSITMAPERIRPGLASVHLRIRARRIKERERGSFLFHSGYNFCFRLPADKRVSAGWPQHALFVVLSAIHFAKRNPAQIVRCRAGRRSYLFWLAPSCTAELPCGIRFRHGFAGSAIPLLEGM